MFTFYEKDIIFAPLFEVRLKIVFFETYFFLPNYAGVAELVDALDLGSSAARRGGSIPFTRTVKRGFKVKLRTLFFF